MASMPSSEPARLAASPSTCSASAPMRERAVIGRSSFSSLTMSGDPFDALEQDCGKATPAMAAVASPAGVARPSECPTNHGDFVGEPLETLACIFPTAAGGGRSGLCFSPVVQPLRVLALRTSTASPSLIRHLVPPLPQRHRREHIQLGERTGPAARLPVSLPPPLALGVSQRRRLHVPGAHRRRLRSLHGLDCGNTGQGFNGGVQHPRGPSGVDMERVHLVPVRHPQDG